MNGDPSRTRGPAAHAAMLVVFAAFFTAGVGVWVTPVQTQGWQGKEETRDGVVHVLNPAKPSSAAVVASPKELWRTGGEGDEDVLFGVIAQITSDDSGNVYVLDAQLNQVVVFSPEGEYVRVIGREGEGPGEFQRPSDLFLTADGNVAVMQRMPGRIVLLTPEGKPVGDMRVPEPEDGGMQMFGGGRLAAEHVVLNVNQFAQRDAGFSTITSLIAVDPSGNLMATYFEKRDESDFANMVFDEKKMSLGTLVWSVGRDGRVFTSDDFDAYRIQVWNPDGSLARVVEKEYTHRKRSTEDMKRFAPAVRVRQGDRTRSPEVKTSDTDRDIQQIFPRGNGDVWVLSSKGAFDVPKGVMGTFDVFDADGKLARHITLNGTGNWAEDGFYVVGDRFYVVTGLRSARRAMFGMGEGAETEEEEDEPMTLVCYGLGPAARAEK